MRKSRFTEEQIVGVLKEAEAGQKVETVCRKHGISEHTFYRWKAKYGDLRDRSARFGGTGLAQAGTRDAGCLADRVTRR